VSVRGKKFPSSPPTKKKAPGSRGKPEAGRRTPNTVLTTVFSVLLIFTAAEVDGEQCGSPSWHS